MNGMMGLNNVRGILIYSFFCARRSCCFGAVLLDTCVFSVVVLVLTSLAGFTNVFRCVQCMELLEKNILYHLLSSVDRWSHIGLIWDVNGAIFNVPC